MEQSDALAPLKGVRVLELGNYIAAPTAGRMLGERVRLSVSLLDELDELDDPNRARATQDARLKAQAFEWLLRANARA